jgi:hypothetical protein
LQNDEVLRGFFALVVGRTLRQMVLEYNHLPGLLRVTWEPYRVGSALEGALELEIDFESMETLLDYVD